MSNPVLSIKIKLGFMIADHSNVAIDRLLLVKIFSDFNARKEKYLTR